MNSAQDNKRTTRDKAAAARAAAQAADQRRQRMITLVGLLGVVVLVGLIIGGAIYVNKSSSESGNGSVTLPTVDPAAPLPKTVLGSSSPQAYGVPFGSKESAPVLEVWEDFQCPLCAKFEAKSGAAIAKLASDGVLRLIERPATFLDQAFPQSDHSSARATAAWGCAIDAGVGAAYRSTVLANQPAVEGVGYTDAQLVEFGTQVGLTGTAATTFASCVADHTYLGWAVNSAQAFNDNAIAGTPTVLVNGTELPEAVVLGPTDALVAYLEAQVQQ